MAATRAPPGRLPRASSRRCGTPGPAARAHADMKHLEPSVHLEAVVDAPPSAVLDVLADWRKNLLWEQGLRESEPVTPEPVTPEPVTPSRSASAPACAGFGS